MRKNVASQVIGAQMITAADGTAFTGDGGTQTTGTVGSGACTHEGNGFHTYAPAQAETNYDHIGFTFTGTGAIPATVQVYPTYPQTGDSYARLGAPVTSVSADIAAVKADTAAVKTKTDFLPSATAGAAGGVFIAGANAATSITTALTANIIGDITGNLSGSVGSVTGLTASDVGSIKTKTDFLPSVTAGAAGGLFIAGTNAATTITTSLTTTFTGNLTGNVGGNVTGSVGSVSGLTAATVHSDLDDIQARLPAALVSGRMDVSVGAIAADAITAAATAADFGTEVGTAVWATAARTLTALDEDSTTLDLDATIRAAVGLASANLDTQLGTLPTAAENADAVWEEAIADHSGTVGSTAEALAAAGAAGDPWNTALPGAYAAGKAGYILGTNLNATVSSRATQTSVDDLPTNAELATALGTADDAVLAAVGAIPTATENADALLDRDMGAGADTQTRSPRNAFRFIRNGFSTSGATLTVLKEDDTTPAYTRTLTTDPAAEPIVGVD